MNIKLMLLYGICGLDYKDKGRIRGAYSSSGFEKAMTLLEEEIEKIGPDFVVSGEFLFNIEDIINNKHLVQDIAKNLKCNLLFTPCNSSKTLTDVEKYLYGADIPIEKVNTLRPYTPQAVGFWINKNGEMYAMPKIGKKIMHIIPNTNIGVSICSELWHRKPTPEDFSGAALLLHPAREEDEMYAQYRTNALSQGYSYEQIERVCPLVEDGIMPRHSAFIGGNVDAFIKGNIPVISCNLSARATGVTFLPSGIKIKKAEYNSDYAFIELSSKE
jgi:hypothetical protein